MNEIIEPQQKIVIDGQNVAFWPCGKNSAKDWNLVIEAAKYYSDRGLEVHVYLPVHFFTRFDNDYKKTLRKYCKIQVIDCGENKSMDDEQMIAYARLKDCYYLSNDKKMCHHFKENNLESRAWCESHRIEFKFDRDDVFIPLSNPFPNVEIIADQY